MKTRRLDHIDLRVKDLAVAFKFYRKLLPELGFTCDCSDSDWGTFYATGRDKPSEFFGFTEDRDHQPNGTRIAFWAHTREEVDRIARLVREIGGKNL
jgi:predicted enzyme related to lactoylglutathione lyase